MTNSLFVPAPSNSGPQLSQVESLTIAAAVKLPDEAEAKLQKLLAYRLLDFGQHRQALSDARGGIEVFKQKIFDAYREPWENLKDKPGFERLAAEHASLQRDLAVAQRADQLWASDIPISRGALSLLSTLAGEAARFVNRNRNLKEAEPVKLSKSDTAEALREALQDAEDRIAAVEYSWPPFDVALGTVEDEINQKAKLPAVNVRERETPEQAPRPLPVKMEVSTIWPQVSSSHSTGPGSRLYLHQPDSIAVVLALHKEAILSHLRGELEREYRAAEEAGTLFLRARERKKALEEAKAGKLLIERKLSQLFWNGASATILHREISPAALLGVE